MANFTDPIRAAFGRYMGAYYDQVVADTPALTEFASRGFSKSVVWAPGRMVDQVEKMLAAWRRNDTSGSSQPTPLLPVMIAAMSKDYTPAPLDYAVPLGNSVPVMIPGDTKERVFRMRVMPCEVKVQIAIFAQEQSTARSLAMQLHLFACAIENRRFFASYPLVGVNEPWPVVLERPEVSAVNPPTDIENISILVADIMLLATVPLLEGPKTGQPNDGKGTGSPDDPNGYLVVVRNELTTGPNPNWTPDKTWNVGQP